MKMSACIGFDASTGICAQSKSLRTPAPWEVRSYSKAILYGLGNLNPVHCFSVTED